MAGQPSLSTADCYRALGLTVGASPDRVKAAYRQLARRYHPDCNPGNRQAQERFVAIALAYRQLSSGGEGDAGASAETLVSPPLSEADRQLKWQSYQELRKHLEGGRFLRAVSLSDSLVRRFPKDLEVRQWQAIACHQYGRHLAAERQYRPAQNYFQKAQRADPQNRSLQAAVARDLQQILQVTQQQGR